MKGNELTLELGGEAKALGGQMGRGPDPGGGVVDRARLGLGGGDELLDRFDVLVGRDHQNQWHVAERRDAGKVLHRIIGHVLDRRRGHQRVGMDQDRMAVRIRLGHGADADGPAPARPVFDDDGLTDVGRDVLEHRSRKQVGGAAGREWHDDLDALGRPNLGRLRRERPNHRPHGCGCRHRGKRSQSARVPSVHAVVLPRPPRHATLPTGGRLSLADHKRPALVWRFRSPHHYLQRVRNADF